MAAIYNNFTCLFLNLFKNEGMFPF
jgi:hypothetical protein